VRKSFLAISDAALLALAQNMSTRISAGFADYGLNADQAAALASATASYQAALAAVSDPGTRTKALVADKNDSRDRLKYRIGKTAKIIYGQDDVTDGQLIELGLPVPDREPTPIGAPETAPDTKVVSMNGWLAKLRLSAVGTDSRGKPPGVSGANIYTYVGEIPPNDINAWKFEGDTSKVIFPLQLPATLAVGTKVWITANWKNPRFQTGPACAPISVIIGGGVTTLAA
jgi:hypothetical protein